MGSPATNLIAAAVVVAVFGAVVVRQILGRGPEVWAIFVVGAGATVLLGVLAPSGAGAAIVADGPVLVFLLALFLFADALEVAGALDHLARWLVGRTRTAAAVPALIFLGFGAATLFLLNDAMVVIGVPVLIGLAARMRTDARALLLPLAFAVTVGSVATPFGNPQNLLVAGESGIADPTWTFLRYLLVPTLINLGLGAAYVHARYARTMDRSSAEFESLRASSPPLVPPGFGRHVREHPVLVAFPATIVAILGIDLGASFLHGPLVPSWEIAAVGAAALLVLSPRRVRIVSTVSWRVLLLFAALFVVVAGAVAGGVIPGIERFLPILGPGHGNADLVRISAVSIVGPQLFSNVPWVGLQISVLGSLGYGAGTPIAWMALAGVSTLAGNVTLLGAASNLIVAELAEEAGISIRLGRFVRDALPLAAITIAVVVGCLAIGL